MNNRSLSLFALGAFVLAAAPASAQDSQQTFTRPRTVAQTPQAKAPAEKPAATPQTTQTPTQPSSRTPAPQTTAPPATPPASVKTTAPQASPSASPASQNPSPSGAPVTVPSITPIDPSFPAPPLKAAKPLSLNKVRKELQEAERLLRSRSTATASTPDISWVTLAALEQDSGQIHLLTLPKETFITRDAEVLMNTSAGLRVRLRIIRPNYVNTAVRISDMDGRQLTPLLVEYPIEKFGRFREMAYYTSVHPALLTPELVKTGQTYVRTMLDLAARRLKDKNQFIAPEIVDIAERLCVVEHADHQRFRTESRGELFNEIYALFALNELNTYRYSVSSAGAGGMVQMIPSTYDMIRRLHPSVGLNPDFVLGMRNHGNALEAMLLHMQDNWNALAYNEDVREAMRQGWADQTDLVAAGYNSNSARLPGYIRRGGPSWRTLIPRETQMYLQIYSSVEGLVQFKNRAPEKGAKAEAKDN